MLGSATAEKRRKEKKPVIVLLNHDIPTLVTLTLDGKRCPGSPVNPHDECNETLLGDLALLHEVKSLLRYRVSGSVVLAIASNVVCTHDEGLYVGAIVIDVLDPDISAVLLLSMAALTSCPTLFDNLNVRIKGSAGLIVRFSDKEQAHKMPSDTLGLEGHAYEAV